MLTEPNKIGYQAHIPLGILFEAAAYHSYRDGLVQVRCTGRQAFLGWALRPVGEDMGLTDPNAAVIVCRLRRPLSGPAGFCGVRGPAEMGLLVSLLWFAIHLAGRRLNTTFHCPEQRAYRWLACLDLKNLWRVLIG